jgi:hypothetical protein
VIFASSFHSQGHIALDQAVFPEKTPGFVLDVLARRALWSDGLDYRHGELGNLLHCFSTRLVTSTTGTIRYIFSNIFYHRWRLCDAWQRGGFRSRSHQIQICEMVKTTSNRPIKLWYGSRSFQRYCFEKYQVASLLCKLLQAHQAEAPRFAGRSLYRLTRYGFEPGPSL